MKKQVIFALVALISGCSVANGLVPKVPSATTLSESTRGTSDKKVLNTEIGTSTLPIVIYKPVHLAIPNPSVTKEVIEQNVRTWFEGSTFTSIEIAQVTMQWAKDNLNHNSRVFTPESSLWAATVKGSLIIKTPINHSGSLPQGTSAYMAFDVETGSVVAMRLAK